MKVLQTRLIALAGSVFVTGALVNLAQPQSFDRAYKGNLECEQIPDQHRRLRTPLTMTVRNGRVIASAPTYDIDGLHLITSTVAAGRVDETGMFNLGCVVYTREAELHANYTGTLSAAGGTLTGTQVWTRSTGKGGVTRTCTGTVLEVGLPR